MSSYPRETKEFQPFRVEVDGIEVLTGVEVAVIRPATRPVELDWTNPTALDAGGLAVLIDTLDLGVWNVWARVTTVHELVVVYCGDFKII